MKILFILGLSLLTSTSSFAIDEVTIGSYVAKDLVSRKLESLDYVDITNLQVSQAEAALTRTLGNGFQKAVDYMYNVVEEKNDSTDIVTVKFTSKGLNFHCPSVYIRIKEVEGEGRVSLRECKASDSRFIEKKPIFFKL